MIRKVWRALWVGLVPGSRLGVAYWAAWFTGGLIVEASFWGNAAWFVLLALNAYSLFYQIRNKNLPPQ
jgi:hypothetical protein